MGYYANHGLQRWHFSDLRELLARASPLRSGDQLAGVAADSAGQPAPTKA